MSHREFKDRLYPEFARVAQALGSDRRLELVDLLSQAPRRVEALAEETSMTVANVSQHLQVLKNARLVESERQGTAVTYRLASPGVMSLWLALRGVAEDRLPEINKLRNEFSNDVDGPEMQREDLQRLLKNGKVLLVDVRPAMEFHHGHVEGAISIPIEELEKRVDELPRNKPIVTYCRGAYCLFADEAVALLRKRGFDAVRLEGGWPEWANEDRVVASSHANLAGQAQLAKRTPARKGTRR
jgi:rhodanese-related sulfurtransferase